MHAGIRGDFGEAAGHQRPAFRQHVNPVADRADQVHVVLDDAERDAVGLEFADQRDDVLQQGRRDAGGRLVEQHQRRLQQQHARQFQQLLLAARKCRGRMIGQLPQPDALEHVAGLGRVACFLVAARRRVRTALPAMASPRWCMRRQQQVFQHRQPAQVHARSGRCGPARAPRCGASAAGDIAAVEMPPCRCPA